MTAGLSDDALDLAAAEALGPRSAAPKPDDFASGFRAASRIHAANLEIIINDRFGGFVNREHAAVLRDAAGDMREAEVPT